MTNFNWSQKLRHQMIYIHGQTNPHCCQAMHLNSNILHKIEPLTYVGNVNSWRGKEKQAGMLKMNYPNQRETMEAFESHAGA